MKYLKKWNLYFEDLKIEDSDTSDIKKAKEKLNTLRLQIDEFNSKYKEIDIAYKSNDDKKILDMEKKLFGNSDIKNGPDRNEFLVKYLNIAKKKREIEKGVNQIGIDDLNLRKSQDMVSITTDSGIKTQNNKEMIRIKQKIQNTKNSIEKKKVDISNSFQNIQKEMLEREKEMLDYISKIKKDSNSEY